MKMHAQRGLTFANDVTARPKILGPHLRPEVVPFVFGNFRKLGARGSQGSFVVGLTHVRRALEVVPASDSRQYYGPMP